MKSQSSDQVAQSYKPLPKAPKKPLSEDVFGDIPQLDLSAFSDRERKREVRKRKKEAQKLIPKLSPEEKTFEATRGYTIAEMEELVSRPARRWTKAQDEEINRELSYESLRAKTERELEHVDVHRLFSRADHLDDDESEDEDQPLNPSESKEHKRRAPLRKRSTSNVEDFELFRDRGVIGLREFVDATNPQAQRENARIHYDVDERPYESNYGEDDIDVKGKQQHRTVYEDDRLHEEDLVVQTLKSERAANRNRTERHSRPTKGSGFEGPSIRLSLEK
jgi:hypothetical protein